MKQLRSALSPLHICPPHHCQPRKPSSAPIFSSVPGPKSPFPGRQGGLGFAGRAVGGSGVAGTMQRVCLLQLKWQFLRGKRESESEVLLHIQSLHLLIK